MPPAFRRGTTVALRPPAVRRMPAETGCSWSASDTASGTTAAADGLNQTELPWLRDDLTLALAAGCTLKAAAHAAITSGKLVHVTVFGGDY